MCGQVRLHCWAELLHKYKSGPGQSWLWWLRFLQSGARLWVSWWGSRRIGFSPCFVRDITHNWVQSLKHIFTGTLIDEIMAQTLWHPCVFSFTSKFIALLCVQCLLLTFCPSLTTFLYHDWAILHLVAPVQHAQLTLWGNVWCDFHQPFPCLIFHKICFCLSWYYHQNTKF